MYPNSIDTLAPRTLRPKYIIYYLGTWTLWEKPKDSGLEPGVEAPEQGAPSGPQSDADASGFRSLVLDSERGYLRKFELLGARLLKKRVGLGFQSLGSLCRSLGFRVLGAGFRLFGS